MLSKFIKSAWHLSKVFLYWALTPVLLLALTTYVPIKHWSLGFQDYLELLKVLAWPLTVICVLFLFRRIFTYLFFSMDSFNFFGASGQLRKVNEVIQEEVDKRSMEDAERKERSRKMDELAGRVESAETDRADAVASIKLAKQAIEEWRKSDAENHRKITARDTEIRRLKELIPVLASQGMPMLRTPSGIVVQGSLPMRYWLAGDGRRYVFPNDETFRTWFPNEDQALVQRISDDELVKIPIGGNITYRPGSRLVKLQTDDSKIYAVADGGTLRWIRSAVAGEGIFGSDWLSRADGIPDMFFVNYVVGPPIDSVGDYDPALESAKARLP